MSSTLTRKAVTSNKVLVKNMWNILHVLDIVQTLVLTSHANSKYGIHFIDSINVWLYKPLSWLTKTQISIFEQMNTGQLELTLRKIIVTNIHISTVH